MSTKNVKSGIHGSSSASSSKISSKSATATITSQATTEIEAVAGALNIPLIRSKDNAKQLPVYAAALQRASDDYLAAENLDVIQLELEKMLSNVALRYRMLKSEYDSLDRDEKRLERRAKHTVTSGEKAPTSPAAAVASCSNSTSNGKRKRDDSSSSSSVRKSKQSSTITTQKHAKHTKGNSAPIVQSDDSMDGAAASAHATSASARDQVPPKLTLPKNDMPNKFWLSVEPYCMPLTNEDLRLIDELLEQYSGPLVPPIPELGPHYSSVWAEEQLKEIQQDSSVKSNRVKPQNTEASAMLKKADTLMDQGVTGPLTQRLVSALMEEHLLPSPATESAVELDTVQCKSEQAICGASQSNLRSLSMLRNCMGIEQRIKKELMEQGILDASDLATNGDEDEIHSEIKRLTTELSTIADYNGSALKRLREAAAEEIKRLEIKRKLDAIDQEIMEAYKRSMQSKAKRKPLSNEEQQEIFRLTAEQKTLSDQLENAQTKTFLFE